jgi:hypothetical protein
VAHKVTTGLSIERSETLANSLGLDLEPKIPGLQAKLSYKLEDQFGLKFNITETEETSRELTLTNPSSDSYRRFSFWHVDHLLSVNVLKVPVEINASGEVRPDWHLSDQVQFTETNESVVTYAIVRRSRASGREVS